MAAPALIEPRGIEDAIVALLDREDVTDPDTAARLARVRLDLERQLAAILTE